jgi:hypothetical protein
VLWVVCEFKFELILIGFVGVKVMVVARVVAQAEVAQLLLHQ